MPKVSFVVPTHNRIEWLPLCLQSLLTQTLEDIEIIVINDCSTDGTKEFLDEWAAQFPKMVIVHNETNLGAGTSRNKGAYMAKSEIVAVCDDDDVYVETRAQDIVDWFEQHPESEMVNFPYLSINYFDQVLDQFAGEAFDHDGFLKDGGVNYWCNPSAAYKKNSMAEVGGYPSEKEGITDDYQMLQSWVKSGKKVDFCGNKNGDIPFSTLHRILPNSMMSKIRGFKPEWVNANH